jgi:hypothetical protein
MKIRLITSLLFAGSLAFACGPRSRAEPRAFATASPVKLSARTSREAPPTETGLPVTSWLHVEVAQRDVKFALNVTNVGVKRVELSFPSGKSYDFVVVDSAGAQVWQWSSNRMFTQGVQTRQLVKGDTITVGEHWVPTHPGRYTAIATLNSSNFPIEQRAQFVIP